MISYLTPDLILDLILNLIPELIHDPIPDLIPHLIHFVCPMTWLRRPACHLITLLTLTRL